MEDTTLQPIERKSLFRKFADVLAVVFHPCFMFFYCFLIISAFGGQIYWKVFYTVISFTVIIPAIFPLVYARDAFLKDRKKRNVPLIFTFCSYLVCLAWLFYLIPKENATGYDLEVKNAALASFIHAILVLLFCQLIGLAMLFIVNLKYKISLHANGVGFFLAFLLLIFRYGYGGIVAKSALEHHLFFYYCLIIVTLLAIVIWQRVKSGSHNVSQVILGLISGFATTVIIISTLLGLCNNGFFINPSH